MTRPVCHKPAPEADGRRPEAALPPGVRSLAEILEELAALLPGLRQALESHQADNRPRIEPLALRPQDLAAAIGVDERTIQRWRSSGRFPPPDIKHSRTLLWRVETIRQWLERGGRP
jgi:hypothetical protein